MSCGEHCDDRFAFYGAIGESENETLAYIDTLETPHFPGVIVGHHVHAVSSFPTLRNARCRWSCPAATVSQ